MANYTYSQVTLPYNLTRNYILLFVLWPFLACVIAIMNFGQKEAKNVVYAFLVYYGLSFVVGNEGIDAFRIASTLKANSMLPFSDFFNVVLGVYSNDTSVDFVEPFISFMVSRISDNYRLLFGAFAAVFGYFYVKSIGLLFSEGEKSLGWNSVIHLVFLASILPVTSINGFRMWTAAWVFFYGTYNVVLYRNLRYLLVTFSACLIHFSFLSANAILIAYLLAGNRNLIYFALVVVSFVLPGLIEPLVQSSYGILGSAALKARVQMYTDSAYVQLRQESIEQVAWFMQIGSDLVLYYLIIAIAFLRFRMRKYGSDEAEKNLFSFLLLFLAFVNFGMPIPSFGGRFMILFFMFATLYIYRYFAANESKSIEPITIIGLFPMLLFAAITFRQGSETMNAWIFTPGIGFPWLVPGLTVFDILFS